METQEFNRVWNVVAWRPSDGHVYASGVRVTSFGSHGDTERVKNKVLAEVLSNNENVNVEDLEIRIVPFA
jgi:hypothetical protein